MDQTKAGPDILVTVPVIVGMERGNVVPSAVPQQTLEMIVDSCIVTGEQFSDLS